jgi:uncharacterized membrane protein
MSTNLQRQDAACAHRRASIQRWGGLLGGGALAIYGLTRRSLSGVAIAGAGGALAYAGAKTRSVPREIVAQSRILLNCSPQDAYQFWRDFENLPRFMLHVESVQQTGDRLFRWVALGPGASRISWDAELLTDRPNEAIAWRSLPSSEIGVEATVAFRNAPADRGTLVDAHIRYQSLAGAAGRAIAKVMGKYPDFLLRQDLRRFKALVETGEIPTTEGQPHGPRSVAVAALRLADPNRPFRPQSELKEVLRAMRRIA